MHYLGEYIEKFKGGNKNLTQAEAVVAGISLRGGWLQRDKYKRVDGDAMYAAYLRAPRNGANSKKSKSARKKAKYYASPVVILVSNGEVVTEATPALDERGRYVNSAAFLESFEWRQLRFQTLKKFGRKCQCCGATPSTGAVMNVDHIKPRRRFPELALDPDNLQVLCHECNHGKSNDIADFRGNV